MSEQCAPAKKPLIDARTFTPRELAAYPWRPGHWNPLNLYASTPEGDVDLGRADSRTAAEVVIAAVNAYTGDAPAAGSSRDVLVGGFLVRAATPELAELIAVAVNADGRLDAVIVPGVRDLRQALAGLRADFHARQIATAKQATSCAISGAHDIEALTQTETWGQAVEMVDAVLAGLPPAGEGGGL